MLKSLTNFILNKKNIAKEITSTPLAAKGNNIDCNFPLPTFYYVDICNICNLHCVFCPTGQRKSGLTKGMMTKEQYAIILQKISPYAEQIHLYNWGEPFLNKDIISIISMTADEKIFTAIHSNLTFKELSDYEAEKIVRSGLSFLNVSLDGASQETYEKYRREGNFKRVVKNIRKIQSAKEKFNVNMPVRWRFLINAFNEHEQTKAIAMAKELNVILQFDLMGVQDNSWATKMHNRNYVQTWPIIHFNGLIPDKINCSPSMPIVLNSSLKAYCIQPFNWMTINVNGDVTPCCSVYGDEYGVGNIFHNGIEEIWNGEMMKLCRKFLMNYGSEQYTSSICELKPCGVRYKAITPDKFLHFAEIDLEIINGAWKENNEEWIWVANDSTFVIKSQKTGELNFDLIFPDNDMHRIILPCCVKIKLNNEVICIVNIEKNGKNRIKIPIDISQPQKMQIICNKFVVPDNISSNGDKRKLSVILDRFKLTY